MLKEKPELEMYLKERFLKLSFWMAIPNYFKKILIKKFNSNINSFLFYYEEFILFNKTKNIYNEIKKLQDNYTKNDKRDIKMLKFLYQFCYKHYLSLYYLRQDNSYIVKKTFKKQLILSRIINKLICLYEKLENKNFLRNYEISLIKYLQLFSINCTFFYNVINLKSFYKSNYIKNL